jgi:hypothetical protein
MMIALKYRKSTLTFESEGREFKYFRGRQEKSKPWLNMFLLIVNQKLLGDNDGLTERR